MTRADLQVMAADDEQWAEFDRLATRSYGHRVDDVTTLRPHADARVGLLGKKVVAGGLGMLLPQHFGGRPVLSACLATGCVAPEERGDRLAERMIAERVGVLSHQGAVISTVWTKAAGYAHHLGWEVVTPVFAWSVATEELRRAFGEAGQQVGIEHGMTPDVPDLHVGLASDWNGPVQRPDWWWTWKQAKSDLTSYTFTDDSTLVGYLSLATKRHERHGMTLQVHDFWASGQAAAEAMYGFLGRFETRAERINFRRGVLPPDPLLLQRLNRHRVVAESWHPWMIRLLDVPAALGARGWPPDLDTTIVLDVTDAGSRRLALQLRDSKVEVDETDAPAKITLTSRQLAAWYAGAYRSTASVRMAGIDASCETALRDFVRATSNLEPWMPDHF